MRCTRNSKNPYKFGICWPLAFSSTAKYRALARARFLLAGKENESAMREYTLWYSTDMAGEV
jgi:hypothetical protein